jgi:hypothetical protein
MHHRHSLKWNYAVAFFGLLLFAFMGFKFLPLYSLWDDEANTVLFAQSVHETGDTSAVRGNNLIAYRNGAELNDDKKARYVSPLQYYFLAPFVRSDSTDPAAARFPFFILSLFSLILIYRRALKMNLPLPALILLFFLSIGPTSFFLFSLQCRYYALCLFWSIGVAEIYFFSDWARPRNFFLFSLFGALLFISNYLVGLAVFAALFLHAIIFRFKEIHLDLKKIGLFAIPQTIISLPVFLIWNPLGKTVVTLHNTPLDRLNLLFRNFRDFNGGSFGSTLLLVLGLFLLKGETKNRYRQYATIFFAYLIIISIFSPQPVRGTGVADIRYLYPLTVLGFAWMIDLGLVVLKRRPLHFWIYAIFFAFCTLPYSAKFEIPLLSLAKEYVHPADDPYRAVSHWLNENVSAGQTVQSSLDYATYPLMYLAPKVHYLGQFTAEKQIPDYLVGFCDESIATQFPSAYQEVAHFEMSCREHYRPEIFLRSFGKNATNEVVHIFKRVMK